LAIAREERLFALWVKRVKTTMQSITVLVKIRQVAIPCILLLTFSCKECDGFCQGYESEMNKPSKPSVGSSSQGSNLSGFQEKIFNRLKACNVLTEEKIQDAIHSTDKLAANYGFDEEKTQACMADFLCSGQVNPAADADCLRFLQLVYKK
jgi:hypothetical protein